MEKAAVLRFRSLALRVGHHIPTRLAKLQAEVASLEAKLKLAEEALPRYSADIAAAWEVEQEVREKFHPDYYFVLLSPSKSGSPNKWFAGWSRSYPDCSDYVSEGETAAHAICIAALNALGVVI